jgi:hypothetical protein
MYTPPEDNAQGRCLADEKFAGSLLLPSVWMVAMLGGHQTWSPPTQCAAPTWSHVSPQRLQAHKLLPHGVPAIVQNDVEPRHPCTLTARQRYAWGNTDHTGDGGSEDHKWLDSCAHTHTTRAHSHKDKPAATTLSATPSRKETSAWSPKWSVTPSRAAFFTCKIRVGGTQAVHVPLPQCWRTTLLLLCFFVSEDHMSCKAISLCMHHSHAAGSPEGAPGLTMMSASVDPMSVNMAPFSMKCMSAPGNALRHKTCPNMNHKKPERAPILALRRTTH